jgi:hypothetical protein
MSRKELALAYGISVDTLRRWFGRHPKELGHLKDVRLFSPSDVELIFLVLGEPKLVDVITPEEIKIMNKQSLRTNN